MLALLLGCGDPAVDDRQAYITAMRAADWETAWSACGEVRAAEPRGDCQSAVIEKHGHYEACAEMDAGRWKEECLFVAAESLGRRGEVEAAMAACVASAFRAQCQDHLLGMLSMQLLDRPFAEVVEALTKLRPQLVDPRAELHFWRGYWRNRVGRGLPIDASACPTPTCTGAAEQEVSAFIFEQQRRQGTDAFCAAPPPEVDWAVTEETRGWIAAQHVRGCANPPKPLEGPPPRR